MSCWFSFDDQLRVNAYVERIQESKLFWCAMRGGEKENKREFWLVIEMVDQVSQQFEMVPTLELKRIDKADC